MASEEKNLAGDVEHLEPADLAAPDCAQDGGRRAVMARLGRMAAVTAPAMITLLMSTRASAESPPPDP